MSWDLLAFDAPLDFKSPSKHDIPEGWQPKPFGLRCEVKAKLKNILPGIQFSFLEKGSLWGFYSGETFRLEISLGETEDITYIWIAVRGADAHALAIVAQIVRTFGLRGVDLQTGQFFDREAAHESFEQWREVVKKFRKQKIDGS